MKKYGSNGTNKKLVACLVKKKNVTFKVLFYDYKPSFVLSKWKYQLKVSDIIGIIISNLKQKTLKIPLTFT